MHGFTLGFIGVFDTFRSSLMARTVVERVSQELLYINKLCAQSLCKYPRYSPISFL